MSTDREQALAELRAWAEPGAARFVRARLVAACWDAGVRNVAALADAARVARGTIYSDLARHGIHPKDDRDEDPPMLQTIEINGMTGDPEHDVPRLNPAALEVEWERLGKKSHEPDGRPTSEFVRAWERRGAEHWAAEFHNDLVPAAQALLTARARATRAVDVVESRWSALGTATAWMAAHHQYVLAYTEARTALTKWIEAADALADRLRRRHHSALDGWRRALYEEHVPAEQRIPNAEPETPRELLARLEELYQQRRRIVAETLTAGSATIDTTTIDGGPEQQP